MADLKPIGSEKLQGQDKLRRIMEIARFNEVIPNRINETAKTEYSRSLADGNNYEIVKERQGYIIKRTISESETDYIEPMKNRKYYSSYSQALKRLNLVAGELNRINENEEGTSMFGEQKKFTLKTPKPKMDLPEPPAAPSAPPAVPSPELPPSPMDDMGMEDMGMDDMGMEDEMDIDTDIEVDGESVNDNEQVTFKTIQKLTGKLTQKIRTLDNEEGMTSEDIKYVINMVLSSVNLNELSEEDKEDILSKFEEDIEDLGGDDMDGEDLTDDSEVEDIQADMDIPMEGDMEEGYEYDDVDDVNPDDLFDNQESYKFSKFKKRHNKSKSDELDEFFYYDDEESDNDSVDEPFVPSKGRTSKGNKFGSFDDKNWYDNNDASYGGDFDFDYDEEEIHDFPSFKEKHGDTRWFDDNNENGEKLFNRYKELSGGKPFKIRTKKNNLGNGAIFDGIFGESKVDKVLSKYFEVSKKEIIENRQKTEERKTKSITEVRRKMKSVIKLTETIEQELASQKFLEENDKAKIVGKTNKNNLVFENKGKEIKITPEGLLV